MHAPSSYQRAVYEHFRSSSAHLIVKAVAGSGKTTTLLQGLDVIPYGSATLVTSFGADIVTELRDRAPYGTGTTIRTLHSLGREAVVNYLKPTVTEPFRDKMAKHALNILRMFGVNLKKKDANLAEVLHLIEWGRITMSSTEEHILALMDKFDIGIEKLEDAEVAKLVLTVMDRMMRDTSRFDYTDMIWLPFVYDLPLPRFSNVLVDEVQDMNLIQLQLARMMCAADGRIMGLGDDRQAIYGFRGADSQAMERIVEGLHSVQLPLSVSYRCPKLVVAHAQQYVPAIEAAPGAPDGILERIDLEKFWGLVQPGDYVLSRANGPLAIIGTELKMAGKPVKIAGQDISRDLTALIRKSKRRTVEDLRKWLTAYLEEETARLEKLGRLQKLDFLKDLVDTVRSFATGHTHVQRLIQEIQDFYKDSPGGDTILCSTVHKAKGKEADRVFLLRETFLRRPGQEEENIYYVAATRARRELYIVEGDVYKL